ncbi:adenosylcobinamide-GDP ribazoletransferase, partial [Thioclava sp. BHET1]
AVLTLPAPLSALLWMLIVTAGILLIARRQIGGYTGDVLGTVQILTEIAGWAVLVAAS